MDNAELMRRLMRTFLGELEEHAATIESGTLALESGDPDAEEHLHTLFRAAHSLKGAARAVDLEPIVLVAHELESLLGSGGEGRRLGSGALQAMLDAVDVLRQAAADLRHDLPLQAAQLSGAAARVAEIRRAKPVARETPAPKAHARPPGHASRPSREAPAAKPSMHVAQDPDTTIRLGVDKLDRLLDMAGELLVARRQVASRHDELAAVVEDFDRRWRSDGTTVQPGQSAEQLEWLGRRLAELLEHVRVAQRQLEQTASPLEREILKVRMIPFAQICEGMDRSARDLAQEAGKKVELKVVGRDIEVDRAMAAGLRDALQHLLRNAIAHGLEPASARLSQGKPEAGMVTLSASFGGGRVLVRVEDDGRGFDVEALRRRARSRGIDAPEDDDAALALAFEPELTTAGELSHVAGRGIGLYAVRKTVDLLRGRIQVESQPGKGACFMLSLPLSMGLLASLVVRAGGQLFALDASAVIGLRHVDLAALGVAQGRDVLVLPEKTVPVADLQELLGRRRSDLPLNPSGVPVVLLAGSATQVAILVDELVAELPLVVKDLGPRLQGLRHIGGGAVLNDGQVALILEAQALVDDLTGPNRVGGGLSERVGQAAQDVRRRILVADDSVTTRSLVQALLEAAGYEIVVAEDGMDAWMRLQENDVDLVVSDVEMPRMDGIALTEAIRGSRRLKQLPVILVTALESEQDRQRGQDAGADAYLVKSAFDQTELLQTIGQIL